MVKRFDAAAHPVTLLTLGRDSCNLDTRVTDRGIPKMIKTLFAGSAALALTTGAAMADFSLTVLHTNDFHARFEPISKYDSGCSAEDNTEGKCFGGSARLVTGVEAARARAGNTPTLLVDGGDQFQGTLFYTYYKGKMAAEMMNKLGYDAMTVGTPSKKTQSHDTKRS